MKHILTLALCILVAAEWLGLPVGLVSAAIGLLAVAVILWLKPAASVIDPAVRYAGLFAALPLAFGQERNISAMVLAFVAMLPSTPLYLRLVIVAVVCLSGVHAALLGVSVGAFVMCVTRRPHLAEIGAACLLLPGGIILMRHLTPSACGHADIWSMALEMVYRSPFTGSGQFAAYWRASRPECPPYLHAHSLPLQVAAEHGLIGLLALALDVIVAAWMLLQRRSTSAPYWPALLALAAMSLVDVPEVRGYVCLFGLITFALALL